MIPINFFDWRAGEDLSSENRWVKLAKIIPWAEFEDEYAKLFSSTEGAVAKPFRMALGALIIKEKLKISDRETVEQIRENPYLQYFIGLLSYTNEPPFEASTMVNFRERITLELVNKINKSIVLKELEKKEEKEDKLSEVEKENKGKMMSDATCVPIDITYPTDIGLLNKARETTEKIIDKLYKPLKEKLVKKPRTYRIKARKEYLKVAKKKKISTKERRKGIRKQLQYLRRNLLHIEKLISLGAELEWLNKNEEKKLETIKKLYEQQLYMYENKKKSVEKRIVSLHQPHVRPIIRGKASKKVEFGAKISVIYQERFILLERIEWENYNEGEDLIEQIERYKKNTRYYPESVHVDKIYRNRKNRAYCKKHGIRMSGPPLGRPPKNISVEQKKQAHEDECIRSAIEGKFGQGKRRYGLDLIKMKRSDTAETAIAISCLVINLNTIIKSILSFIFYHFSVKKSNYLDLMIRENYQYQLLLKNRVILKNKLFREKIV